MKEKTIRKRHTLEFKKAAIAKAKQAGNVSAVARDLGLHVSLLHSWVNKELVATNKGLTLEDAIAEKQEIQRLKRDLSRLKEENEILKKATAYFAQGHLK
jgi:transposase